MTGRIDRRRTRILTAIKNEPKPFKRIAKELGLSNTIVKKDLFEMLVSRKIEETPKGYLCLKQ